MEKRKRARIASGYWHGQDAYVLSKDNGTPDVILVGGYSEDEALSIRKLYRKWGDVCCDEDNPLTPYQDSILNVDGSEWREQNS